MQSPFAADDLSLNGFDAAKINEMLKAGIDAAKEGNRAEARMLLLRVSESQPENETAWLWLASISEYPEELLVFLNNVLNINPHNERALEWSKATKSLLAKTFVQRGINASRENRKDFASQCFHQALAHDEANEMAWLWLASVADSPEEKAAHLEKVLSLNPENETAQASLRAIRQQASQALLKKANVAAISGEHEAAREMLDELMNLSPEMEEAWILKAYLSAAHEEKIACFEKVLALNPENETAQAGIDSLNAIRQRELERAAQKAELERLQTAAAQQTEAPESAVLNEVPELFFDLNSAAQNHPANEEYPDFNYTEDAEDDIHKTSTADRAESSFVQDGPTQELEEEFVQNLEVQSAFGREFESQPDGDENGRQIQEFFAEENAENDFPESPVSEPSTETEAEEFAQETAPDIRFAETISASRTNEMDAYESKDFEIMTKEDSYTQENVSQFEENSLKQDEEISRPAYSAEEFFEPVIKETFAEQSFASNNGQRAENAVQENNFPEYHQETGQASEAFAQTGFLAAENESPADGDFESVDEIEEICVDETETLDNYFQVEDESDENHFDESERSEPYVELEEESSIAAQKSLAQPAAFDCPFCAAVNEPQSFVCPSCQAVLTLSDLEMLLSNSQADRPLLAEAIERMESEMAARPFTGDELTALGIAHLNAKNLRQGFIYLQQASQMNQNNVVLGGQVNALAIRLDEIEQHESKTQEAKSCTILVVDDSPTVRKLISGKLEKSGHTVVLAVDGMDALAKINEVVPDLVLLDITMPRMDGYQVCKLIRNNNTTKDIPVVMISGKDGFFDKVRGRMAGSTGYITKPFGPDTLMRTIDAYLN
jgi:twitching motility two-component system response regulator PilG